MKKSDLYREWARVLDMCANTNVKPEDCLEYEGDITGWPLVLDSNIEHYSFAVAILEGKPVFVGDVVYSKLTKDMVVVTNTYLDIDKYSWDPTKKTFTLNGVTLPCPTRSGSARYPIEINNGYLHWWQCEQDRDKVVWAIRKLLNDNTI